MIVYTPKTEFPSQITCLVKPWLDMFKHNLGSQTMTQLVMQKSDFSVWTNHFFTIIQTIKRRHYE